MHFKYTISFNPCHTYVSITGISLLEMEEAKLQSLLMVKQLLGNEASIFPKSSLYSTIIIAEGEDILSTDA